MAQQWKNNQYYPEISSPYHCHKDKNPKIPAFLKPLPNSLLSGADLLKLDTQYI